MNWVRSNPWTATLVAAISLALIVLTWVELAGGFDQPHQQREAHAETGDGEAKFRVLAPNMEITYRGQEDSEPEAEEPDWWGVPFEGWVALLTGALVFSTLGLWRSTFRLGQRADEGLRTLERAYVYGMINREDAENGVSRIIQSFAKQTGGEFSITVRFGIRNFGKTPARIHYLQASLQPMEGGTTAIGLPITYTVLGMNEGTEDYPMTCALTPDQARRIHDCDLRFELTGYVEYFDIWDRKHAQPFRWEYHCKARKMVPREPSEEP